MIRNSIAALLFLAGSVCAKTTENRILIKGQVFAKEAMMPLAFVNIFPEQSNYGTFTNHDGAFELLVHKEDYSKKLVASLVGFQDQFIPIDTTRTYQIFLSQQEVVANSFQPLTADQVMENFRANAKSNYPHRPMVNRIFLREFERIRDEENLYLNEVIVDYLRNGYFDEDGDQMKLIKGRNKIYDESVPFTYTSGGFRDIEGDLIKYPKDFVTSSKGYIYKIDKVIPANQGNIFKIRFEPKGKNNYEGYLYIEDNNFALVKAEVDYSEWGRDLLNKLSKKTGFYWDRLTETVVYKKGVDGRYNLSEIISEGLGYDHQLSTQMIATTELLVIETNIATFFANEFYNIDEGVSLFELDFEASEFFWDKNNYIVMETSFQKGYD